MFHRSTRGRGRHRYHPPDIHKQTQKESKEIQRIAKAKQAHTNLIKKAAMHIFYHRDEFKISLEVAATDYLNEIEDKWFRNDGRKRAEELILKIIHAKTTMQLISILKVVINEGNEGVDSLKTFIFNSINLNFCNKKLYNFKFTFQLKEIIDEVTDIKVRQDKSLLCYAGLYSVDSNFYGFPKELTDKIIITLNNT